MKKRLYTLTIYAIICSCSEFNPDNILDPNGTSYEQSTYNVLVSPFGVQGDSMVAQYRDKVTIRSSEDRPVMITLTLIDTNYLAFKIANEFIGNKDALNLAVLGVSTPKGYKFLEKQINGLSISYSWWKNPDSLIIANFERFGSRIDNLDGEWGTWACESCQFDTSQYIKILDIMGSGWNAGSCIGVDYDIESPNPAIGGLYFKLNNNFDRTRDISNYRYLSFWVKGDKTINYTDILQVEIKKMRSTHEAERAIISKISREWKNYVLCFEPENPSDSFDPWLDNIALSSYTEIEEIVFTFSDQDLIVKKGRIIIDDIVLLDSLPK